MVHQSQKSSSIWSAMVYKERTPMAFQLAPFRHERRKSRRKIKRAEKNINLIVINEECQLCQSTATPVACSKCYTRLCGECIEDFMGNRSAASVAMNWRSQSVSPKF